MQTDQTTKACAHCKQEKPLEQFGLVKGARHSRCKACRNAQRKSRYQENRDQELAWRASYVSNNQAKCSTYAREWRQRNPDVAREKSRRYYNSHRDQYRAHGLRSSREACRTLADSYIRKLIADGKQYDGREITAAEIEEVRARIQAKRAGTHPRRSAEQVREANREQLTKDRAQLTDSYIRRLIMVSKQHQPGTEITPEMLAETRARILAKRLKKGR